MVSLFQTGPNRYQPDEASIYNSEEGKADQEKLAFLVGVVALGLPIIMLLGSASGACFYNSISHYYYSRYLGVVFVGALFFIGSFLIVYRGGNDAEKVLANIAGVCAFAVAIFPTEQSGCELESFSGRALVNFEQTSDGAVTISPATGTQFFELFPNVVIVHGLAALLLFSFLAYYCFNVFTRPLDVHWISKKELTPVKKTRNFIYKFAGSVIVICIIALVLNAIFSFAFWDERNLTFWFEALALWAFGFSWMTKGKFWGMALVD